MPVQVAQSMGAMATMQIMICGMRWDHQMHEGIVISFAALAAILDLLGTWEGTGE
jgi:hypothetical protein